LQSLLESVFESVWRSTGRGRNRSRNRLAIESLDDRLLPSVLSVLNAGQNLYEGDSVRSPNGLFRLSLNER
jgi:hypothetical protein